MPPFLGTKEEAKANNTDICVRYALSAFEDLNGAIKNLRQCFGFPYQEYIGYLNTLSRSHRARREHEGLIDRLRRWAIFSNVDAVVWIDYAKANQPPGSFKVGPRDSRPFSPGHIEICATVMGGAAGSENESEASEAEWPESEMEVLAGGMATAAQLDNAQTMLPLQDLRLSGSRGQGGGPRHTVTRLRLSKHDPAMSGRSGAQSARLADRSPRDTGAMAGTSPRTASPAMKLQLMRSAQEKTSLRNMLQEEVVPAHGSIYKRSIAPGPGYYGAPDADAIQGGLMAAPSFGHRPKGRIDEVAARSAKIPGVGEYEPRAHKRPLADAGSLLGSFAHAERLVMPVDVPRKLPFISPLASQLESHGLNSPATLNTPSTEVAMSAAAKTKAPLYSFGRMRRPF